MGKKAISPEMAARVFALREEKDGWGDFVWSCSAIAKELGVSESTIWRVVAKRAAYTGKNVVMEKKQMDAQWRALETEAFAQVADDPALEEAARKSEAKMLEMLAGKKPTWGDGQLSEAARGRLRLFTEVPQMPEVERPTARQRVMPPSPLDGGDGGADETQGVGVAALERTLADGKAAPVAALGTAKARELGVNPSGLLDHNANGLFAGDLA